MSTEGPSGQGDDEGAFHLRLRELKERGSAVLVVGKVPRSVCIDACERLLGDGETLPRRRLLVFTNGRDTIGARLKAHRPGNASTTDAIAAAVTRSTGVGTLGYADVPVTEMDPESLAELGAAISGWIQETEASHGPLSPGMVRLCIDSLLPLLDEHGEQAVFEFVALTAARVRAVAGMGHFHLPVGRESPVARLLEPTVDAVIELRIGVDGPQQRWLLDGGDLRSPWIQL